MISESFSESKREGEASLPSDLGEYIQHFVSVYIDQVVTCGTSVRVSGREDVRERNWVAKDWFM